MAEQSLLLKTQVFYHCSFSHSALQLWNPLSSPFLLRVHLAVNPAAPAAAGETDKDKRRDQQGPESQRLFPLSVFQWSRGGSLESKIPLAPSALISHYNNSKYRWYNSFGSDVFLNLFNAHIPPFFNSIVTNGTCVVIKHIQQVFLISLTVLAFFSPL